MTADVTVRPAEPADLPAVLGLYRELDPEDAGDLAEARAVFDRMARYPDYALYVAEFEGRVLGTFTLLVMENIAHKASRSAVIEAVAVAGAAQGRGIGRAMMGVALDMAREKGCYKAALSTRMARERAHAFYESLGFKRHGFSFYTELGEMAGLAGVVSPHPTPLPQDRMNPILNSSDTEPGNSRVLSGEREQEGAFHLSPSGIGRPDGAGEGARPFQGMDGRVESGHDDVPGGTSVTEDLS